MTATIPPPLMPSHRPHPFRTSIRTITALILREMATRYGRSPGGYIWAILEPAGMVAFLSLGFSLMLRSPPLGTSFLLFYATGMLPFTYYNTMQKSASRSLSYSKALLTYPIVTWIDAVLARIILNGMTGLLVGYIVIGTVLALSDTRATVEFGPALEAYTMAWMIGVGVGLVNCVLLSFFALWNTVWSIVTRPMFIVSGVLFLYEDLPQAAQAVVWWNPVMHVTGLMRTAVYPMYEATYVSRIYVYGISMTLIALGLLLVARYHKDVLER
ncbi:putative cell surface polysaccharide export ABC-2 transporter permease protein [Oceanicola granulosus HTCC2516]|uniref:Transport permease protein n=1 Tax=Oceanicola granulosus (strain ATCC BAA-861 / DSM 15982 / KCTC 12143 / HTCC2516) TaxID=314256 RepID=Q2C9U5_OCEGH|nr:ABC transporter permease [Oceanicola granulosus]EAR49441.1 putative cell surface polysaccharide export ABC-2 transporter permease protein [Oceanicola granulosus HTCC2516]